MNSELIPLFDFIKFAAQLRQVYRNNNATAERKESVAEHSWHLALIAWVLHEAFEKEFGVTVSQERIIKMCLMHDIVEIVVGDASAWTPIARAEVANQEEAAAQAIFAKLPEALGAEMLALWHEFEKGETLEGKIARGIDRINPALMRLLTGQGWADVAGTVEKLDALQIPRLGFSEVLSQFYSEIKAEAVSTGLLQA